MKNNLLNKIIFNIILVCASGIIIIATVFLTVMKFISDTVYKIRGIFK